MLQAYSVIFTTLDILRHICPGTFGYISADSGIFRILAQLDIFMYIKACIFRTHSGLFRHIENGRHIQPVSGTLFRYYSRVIYAYSEPSLGRFKTLAYLGTECFTHIWACSQSYTYRGMLNTFGHISADSGISRILELPVQIM